MRTIKKLYLQLLSTVDQGMQMELLEADAEGNEIPDGLQPVAMFVADDYGELMFQLFPEGGAVQVPLTELEKAIVVAKNEVRNEAFFEDQMKNLMDDDV